MKFAFSSNAFRKYSLLETIKILADLGYQGIEIMADTPHAFPPDLTNLDIDSIRGALERYNLAVSNINAFMLHAIGDTWRPSWIERDLSQRRKRINHTGNCIDLAAKLGVSTISTEPGGPLLENMTYDEGNTIFRQGLLEIKEQARETGVRVLIEPEPDLLIENSSQFVEFFKGLDADIFGLNFDIGHFFCVNEDPAELVAELQDYIYHFHLEDIAASRKHHHLMPGEGAIDLPGVLKAIKGINYQGFVTVELYPYEDRPVDAARKALAYIQRLAD